MGCFSPDEPAPTDYGKQTADTLKAQVALAPQLYQSEAEYQPKYADLASSDLSKVYGNLINTYNNSLPALTTGQTTANTMQRTSDINDVNNLAGAGRTALRTANPDSAALLDKLNSQANEGLDAGTGLTADQKRQLDTNVAGAQGARGVAYGPASAYADVIANSNAGTQMQQQRQQFGESMVGQDQNFYGDPYEQILGRSSGAGGAATNLLSGANAH
jgi:hypothetical protein